MNRLSGVRRATRVASADPELLRFDSALRRAAARLGGEDGADPLPRVELAYLRDRIAAIPAASPADAVIKLQSLILGRERGGRLSALEVKSLESILAIVEDMIRSDGSIPPRVLGDDSAESDTDVEATLGRMIAELRQLAARHRALLGRNLTLRTESIDTVGKSRALRTHLDELEIALGPAVDTHPASEPKLLALFSYWDERRTGRAMPRRADVDPLDLVDLWPDLALWGRQPGTDFHCRLCGSRITSLVAADPTNKALSELTDAFWVQERATLEAVAQSGRPALSSRLLGGDGPAYRHRSLALPLSEDGRQVDTLLTVTVFRDVRKAGGGSRVGLERFLAAEILS